ncbi:MAG TPA: DNA polymerase I [Bacillota bacterium]|nr:DNA polymerase I [Bacillota bacterium]HPT87378.1 DNA polymerase I [Bacillota bacterium]
MTKKMVIIDGYSLANRAFFALPQLGTQSGQPTNAVYGLAMMLLKLLEESNPDYLITAFDVPQPTFRHQEYKEYKAQRQKMDDALRSQFPLIRRLLEILRIPIYEQAGFEADDVIGTIACKAAAQNIQVEIVTGDRDSFQLVRPKVHVLYTRKGITEMDRVDETYIEQRYQLMPSQLIDLKGLMGDASDNIPGVPGFGEKTALKYLHQYHSIDGIYEHLEEIARPRDRQLLETYREQAYLSRYLATIKIDLPIEINLEECCKHRDFDRGELLEFCKEYEFKSLIKKLAGEAESETMTPTVAMLDAEVDILDEAGLTDAIREIAAEGCCIVQFLATTVNWVDSQWLGVGLAHSRHNWFYPLEPGKSLPEAIRDLLENPDIVKMGHDLKKQMQLLAVNGVQLRGDIEDTLIAGYLINAGVGGLELEDLARDYLHKTIPAVTTGRGSRISLFELPENLDQEEMKQIVGARLECIKQLNTIFQPMLDAMGLRQLYQRVEVPLISVLFEMEQAGIRLDVEALKSFGEELKKRQLELEAEIYDLAGERFNIGSPKQLGVILFEKLGLKAPKKTKTGYSTDVAVLENLIHDHPIISRIMEYRQNVKLQSTYIDSLIALVNPKTGRVHTSFNQAVTTTGRLSSTEPNLQNIPIRSEDGRMIRRAFIPADNDHLLLAADYSQIELRVMAHFSKDEAFMEAFRHHEDIHKYTAAAVRNIPVEEVTKEMRDHAKAINFGIIYGISGFGLANNMGVSRKEADQFIKAYFQQYPGVQRYVDQLIESAREKGEARTLLGRIRKLPDLHSRVFTLRSFAERMARNTPIQGTAADIIKIAMVRIGERLRNEPKLGKLLLQVHDELVFEVPKDKWKELAEMVKTEMEQAVQLDVPLEVDIKIGENWGAMTSVKWED